MTRAVLTFHSIDDTGSVLSFPVRTFRRLIEELATAGIPVVAFEDLLERDAGVTITFDDGMHSVHQHALPVLRQHGFPAHVFLTTGRVGKDISWPGVAGRDESFAMLGWQDIEECVAAGLRVECHTVTHPDLRQLPEERILDECTGADIEIERRTGRRPTLFAYPFGRFDERVRRTLAPRYTGCLTTRLGYLNRSEDMSRVRRLDSYYLQAPIWHEHLFSASTRGYVGVRALIRAVRGIT